MKNLYKKILTLALTVSPGLVLAQAIPVTAPRFTKVETLTGIGGLIGTLISWVTGLFFAVAVLFIFFAAYLYLTAAGDQEKLGKAKSQLIYSIIAILVALLAGSVRFFVQNLLG